MARISTLADRAIRPLGAKSINGVRAVVLLIRLAVVAGQIRSDLSTNAHAVADLHGFDFGADFDGLANDLVTDADGEWAVTPSAIDCVHVAAAYSAAVNCNVDIVVFEVLELELQWKKRQSVSASVKA